MVSIIIFLSQQEKRDYDFALCNHTAYEETEIRSKFNQFNKLCRSVTSMFEVAGIDSSAISRSNRPQ